MKEINNRDRAEFAASALDYFQVACPCGDDDALTDLLCDLMHWANQTSFDFDAELARAKRNYSSELSEESEEKTHVYNGVGDLVDLADALGWNSQASEDESVRAAGYDSYEDMPDHQQCSLIDAGEEAAVEFIRSKGWTVVGYDDERDQVEGKTKYLAHVCTDKVDLELFECAFGFHLAIDASFLEQVSTMFVIECPSCKAGFDIDRLCVQEVEA